MAQFRKDQQKFLPNGNTIFEVVLGASMDGRAYSNTNPMPVSLGSSNITITGNVNIGSVVSVNSAPSNPVHTHITEVGSSGILIVPYLPVHDVRTANVRIINFSTSSNTNIHHSNATAITTLKPLPVINPDLEFTSKNRLKISQYATVFFNTFQYGKETDVWDESVTGTGSATHNSNTNGVDMYVDGVSGSKVIRQTKHVMRYIPGRSSTLTYAIRLEAPVTGIRRRFGLFQEYDGFYFEDAGVIGGDGLPQYNVVVRSSVVGGLVENRIPRNQWNGDRLDGTGDPVHNPSGILADATAQHLVNFEYEWYGAGQVKIGFCINGHTHTIHTFNHGNNLTLPWCSTPFLPIRLELENLTGVSGNHYLYQGSNSLITEGVAEKLGTAANITSPIEGTNLATKNLWYPVLSIRLKSTALRGIVLPTFFQVAAIDNTVVFYKLVRNATIGTGGNGWTNHPDPDAFTQYQTYTSPSAITVANHGVSMDSGIVAGAGGTGIRLDRDVVYQLGRTNLGATSEELTVLVASSITNKDAVVSMTWIEQR